MNSSNILETPSTDLIPTQVFALDSLSMSTLQPMLRLKCSSTRYLLARSNRSPPKRKSMVWTKPPSHPTCQHTTCMQVVVSLLWRIWRPTPCSNSLQTTRMQTLPPLWCPSKLRTRPRITSHWCWCQLLLSFCNWCTFLSCTVQLTVSSQRSRPALASPCAWWAWVTSLTGCLGSFTGRSSTQLSRPRTRLSCASMFSRLSTGLHYGFIFGYLVSPSLDCSSLLRPSLPRPKPLPAPRQASTSAHRSFSSSWLLRTLNSRRKPLLAGSSRRFLWLTARDLWWIILPLVESQTGP